MILGFYNQFKPQILAGIKIHTIRQDRNNRWQAGRVIHFATGVRTPNYDCFMIDECVSVQKISIKYSSNPFWTPQVTVDGENLSANDLQLLASWDGFPSVAEFFEWFDKDFVGKLIHWTDLKYPTTWDSNLLRQIALINADWGDK